MKTYQKWEEGLQVNELKRMLLAAQEDRQEGRQTSDFLTFSDFSDSCCHRRGFTEHRVVGKWMVVGS